MNYVVMSPVGNRKGYVIEEFLSHIKNFDLPPREIVLCLALDHPYDIENFAGCTLRYSPEIGIYDGDLERICTSREILRKFFIYHPENYEYALWIDTDVLCPPETPRRLLEEMEKNECLVVVNKTPSRGSGRLLCGSGVMLTHRHALTSSRFWVGNIYTPEGVEKHLSEDLVFFSIFDQGGYFLKMWAGKKGRVCSEYVKVNHVTEEIK